MTHEKYLIAIDIIAIALIANIAVTTGSFVLTALSVSLYLTAAVAYSYVNQSSIKISHWY